MVQSYPRAALREIANLLVGGQRSFLPIADLEDPFGHMVEEIAKVDSLKQRAELVSTLCIESGIPEDIFHAALSSEDTHSNSRNSYWPAPLRPEAFHGPLGAVIKEIERHTEADPAGILVSLLTSIGSSIGRGPHIFAGGFHHLNEFVCLVGESSHARKGTGWTMASLIMKSIDPYWVENNVHSGLSTGEGLVQLVHDEITKLVWNEQLNDYEEEKVAGEIKDKRAHFWASEFGSVLQVMSRPGVTLPAMLREAWDGGKLGNINKSSPLTATNAHISIVSAITISELMSLIGDSDVVNGFANRFLWVLVRKQRNLPDGGELPETKAYRNATAILKQNRNWASDQVQKVIRHQDTYRFWETLYNSFDMKDTYGIHRSVTSRGIQHIIRLSIIYALCDGEAEIKEKHIRAAEAVWDYCSDSSRIIFGNSTGNKTADLILDELVAFGDQGVPRAILKDKFGKNEPNYYTDRALQILESAGLADVNKVLVGDKKFDEIWYATRR